MSEILSSNSQTSQIPTAYAVAITSLDTVAFLTWCACCPLRMRALLTRRPQVTALLNDYPNTLARAVAFDNNLTSDALAAAPQDTDYASILALSVRQLFGNIELTCGFDGTNHISTDIMAFLRGMCQSFLMGLTIAI